MSKRLKYGIITGFAVFCALIMALTLIMSFKNNRQSTKLLEDSLIPYLELIAEETAELIRPNIDIMLSFDDKDKFYKGDWRNGDDTLDDTYRAAVEELDALRKKVGATYLTTVVNVGGTYRLVYDTDELELEGHEENDPVADGMFGEYEIDGIFEQVFASKKIEAGIMNWEDEYGTYNTGVAPLLAADGSLLLDANGNLVGVVAVDFSDEYLSKHFRQFNTNLIILVVIMFVILAAFGVMLVILLNSVETAQGALRKLANYDKLTELPNRRYLLEQLAEMTSKKNRRPFALFFIDMDNFKKVNDNAGHDAGDALLQHVAVYLQSSFENSKVFRPGAGNINVTARVGGDEFIIIAPDITTSEQAGEFAKELLDGFRTAHVDKYVEKYDVGLSIGVALYPEHTESYHVLITYADMAMYHAKHSGKNSYKVYFDEMAPTNVK